MASPSFDLFLRLLAIAALMDWLLTRTLTRLAIFIPKTPAMISGYEILGFVGQVGSSLAGLLVLVGGSWMIEREWRQQRSMGLPLVLGARMGVALLFLVIIPSGWLAISAHLLTLLAILLLMFPFLQRSLSGEAPLTRLFLLLPVLALIVGEFFHLNSALYTLLRWPGPPASSLMLFNLGEFFAVLSPIALWWMWGRDASRRAWIGGLFPALFFAVLYIAAPAMTATIVIWSTGLTLYLPWPLYVLSIWLAGTTILACLHRRHKAAWGILLLAAAGYAPQFSVQIFFSLIALWVLISGCRDDSLPAQQPIESSQWRSLSAEASSLWRWQ